MIKIIYIALGVLNGFYALPAVETVISGGLTMVIFATYFLTALIFAGFGLFSQVKCHSVHSGTGNKHGRFYAACLWLATLVGILAEISFLNYLCLSLCLMLYFPGCLQKKSGIFISVLMCSPTLIFIIYSNWAVHSVILLLIFVLMFTNTKRWGGVASRVM